MGSSRTGRAGTDQRILIIGGGVAGVEAALTLGIAMPESTITLLTRSPVLRLVLNLVYVPFGVPASGVELQLQEALAPVGCCALRIGGVARVRTKEHRVELTDGSELDWDVLVLAPGTVPAGTNGRRLRTQVDAERLRSELERFEADPTRTSVVIRVLPDNAWSAPAYELAFLTDAWFRAIGRRESVDLTVASCEHEPLHLLGPDPAAVVAGELDRRSVHVLHDVPHERIGAVCGDVTVDIGGVRAARIRGAGRRGPDGFFPTDAFARIAPDVFVVGDASAFPLKAGFAAGWQARRVLTAIGGDVQRLGARTDGVPHDELEYQMDLGDSTLVVRLDADGCMLDGRSCESSAELCQAPPDKLRGTLIRQELIHGPALLSMSERYRRATDVQSRLHHIASGAYGDL